jgi:hypothetical protein
MLSQIGIPLFGGWYIAIVAITANSEQQWFPTACHYNAVTAQPSWTLTYRENQWFSLYYAEKAQNNKDDLFDRHSQRIGSVFRSQFLLWAFHMPHIERAEAQTGSAGLLEPAPAFLIFAEDALREKDQGSPIGAGKIDIASRKLFYP